MTDDANLTIPVTVFEWAAALRLVHLTGPFETRSYGHVRVSGDGARRRWYVTNGYRLACIEGEQCDVEFDLLIPPRLVAMAQYICGTGTHSELEVVDTPFPSLVVRGPGGDVMTPRLPGGYPDIDPLLEDIATRETDVRIGAEQLHTALRVIDISPEPLPDGAFPPELRLGIDEDGLWLSMAWEQCGPSTIGVRSDVMHLRDPKNVDLRPLTELVDVFDDTIEVSFGTGPNEPLVLRGDGIVGLLMPIRTGAESSRRTVEAVIGEVFGADALLRDNDGDYQLKTTGIPVWARILEGSPNALSVFATVAADIDSSPALLAELNDINTGLRFGRVHWEDRIVTVGAELVADTLDPDELRTAFQRVDAIAENTSGLIVSMFGGRDLNRDAERWSAYLDTDLVAEVYPEAYVRLNGADAVQPWPFSGPAHVITADNPYALTRGYDENYQANRDLAVELAKVNARYCECAGESRSGDHVELGFLVWNLPLDTVLRLADHFRQEAVFELTDDELRLVHVQTGDVTTVPRTA